MVPILIAGPLLAYLSVLYLLHTSRLPEKMRDGWPWFGLAAAALAALPMWFILKPLSGAAVPGEIAWTSIETGAAKDALMVGGRRDEPVVGWPNGSFAPQILVQHAAGTNALVSISLGGGFLRDSGGRIRNGVVLEGRSRRFDEFALHIEPGWWIFSPRKLLVEDTLGQSYAGIPIRQSTRTDRVLGMANLVREAAIHLRETPDLAPKAAELENWATFFRVLVGRDGEVRVLDSRTPRETFTVDLKSSPDFTVLWPSPMTPVRFRLRGAKDHQRLQLAFLAPFRLSVSSAAVPSASDGEIQLVATGRPAPGDRAFTLPLGGDLGQFRETVSLTPERLFPRSGSAAAEAPLPFTHRRPAPDTDGVTSEHSLNLEVPGEKRSFYLTLATVDDLPHPVLIWIGIALAWGVMAAGFLLAKRTLRIVDGWSIGGLTVAIWAILIFRLALACRFAAESSRLDALALSGVTAALAALSVVPGLILLAARLRRDRVLNLGSRTVVREGLLLGIYTGLLAAAAWCESVIASRLWPNVRVGATSPGLTDYLLFGVPILFLWCYILLQYIFDIDGRDWNNEDAEAHRVLSQIRDRLLGIGDFAYTVTTRLGRNVWKQIGSIRGAADVATSDRRFWLALGVLLVIQLVGPFLLGLLSGPARVFQEIVVPLLFCWLPAFFWLASRLRFPAGAPIQHFRWWRSVGLAVSMLLVPAFVMPIALRDAGSAIVTLSVFLSTILILLMGKTRRVGWIALAALGTALTGAALVYLNLHSLLPQIKIGAVAERLLILKDEATLKKYLVYFPLRGEEGPSYASVAQGLAHTWENRAIAHEGGMLGLGFGNAPTTLSPVRQDTLQFDSTFSFFVVSEYGLVGGIALLLLYLAPLALVLRSARAHFDIGHGVSAVITASFFLEALAHAAMNLGTIPFTGRSMPLLSVNSTTDIVRWVLLLWIAAQAMQWRVTGEKEGYSDPCSLVAGVRERRSGDRYLRQNERSWNFWPGVAALVGVFFAALLWVTWDGIQVIREPKYAESFGWSDLLDTVNKLAREEKIKLDPTSLTLDLDPELRTSGDTLLEQEVARFNALSKLEKIEGMQRSSPASFRDLLAQVRNLPQYNEVLAELRRRSAQVGPPPYPSLFQLEDSESDDGAESYRIVANEAFNTRSSMHAPSGPGDFLTVSFRNGASGAWTVRGTGFDFDILDRPAESSETPRKVVIEETAGGRFEASEETENQAGTTVRVTVRYRGTDQAYQIRLLGDYHVDEKGLDFKPGILPVTLTQPHKAPTLLKSGETTLLSQGDSLSVAFPQRDLQLVLHAAHGVRGAVVGPAWVMGKWRLALDPNVDLPWLSSYLTALSPQVREIGREQAMKQFGTLSLDQNLQATAAAFVAGKAQSHYSDLLAANDSGRGVLPPRAALTVTRIPSGEVLALGSWPRTSAGAYWRSDAGGELVPPQEWVEQFAPTSMRLRYVGDRNFDRLVAGSATKPLWAAAVLNIHPELSRFFCVAGPQEKENQVFGIEIGKGWNVEESRSLSGGQWADFPSYLARSDNRYEIRLGFLGLAVHGPGGVESSGSSDSTSESMDCHSAWHSYPRFEQAVKFDRDNSTSLTSLQETMLATNLRKMFGIGVSSSDSDSRLVSFWTAQELNDKVASEQDDPEDQPTRFLRGISPETTNFELDRVSAPRAFINLLLGGGANRWANVELAGAFASAVTGRAVVPHATMASPHPDPNRSDFQDIAERLRPGLRAVIESPGGTAHNAFVETSALSAINSLSGVEVYAKTGTLSTVDNKRNTSRILVALVKPGQGGYNGVVLSLVVESADQGTASRWMGQFLASHIAELEKWLH